jgi:hypothetical protein
MQPTSTGAHQRLRFELAGSSLQLHATVVPGGFNFETGVLTVLFDVQEQGAEPFVMTPTTPTGVKARYVDQAGDNWTLIG